MPKALWKSPIYELPDEKGESIKINVTNSVSAGLEANGVIFEVINFLQSQNVNTVLDFGAGALRHCFPLLDAGFVVCAVEYEEQFQKPACLKARNLATKSANFSQLIFPKDFISNKNKFDAVLLCFVLNVMPLPEERKKVVQYLYKKMKNDSYLLYMAQWGQIKDIDKTKRTSDGYYKGSIHNKYKTFYTETNTQATHEFFKKMHLKRIKSFDQGGKVQIFLYKKEKQLWV